jgi:hypothetical protein
MKLNSFSSAIWIILLQRCHSVNFNKLQPVWRKAENNKATFKSEFSHQVLHMTSTSNSKKRTKLFYVEFDDIQANGRPTWQILPFWSSQRKYEHRRHKGVWETQANLWSEHDPPPSSLLSFISLHGNSISLRSTVVLDIVHRRGYLSKKPSKRFVSSVVQWLVCLPLDTRIAGSHPAEAMDA